MVLKKKWSQVRIEDYVRKQICVAGWSYLGQALTGYTAAWSSPIIPKLQDPEQTPLEDVITPAQYSWVGSVMFVGGLLGPYVVGYLANRKGRKACLLLGGVVNLVSYLVLALATNIATIDAGRIIAGSSIGIIQVTNMVYLGEMASTNIRGILLTTSGIFLTVGSLMVYIIGPNVSYSVASWIPFVFGGIFITGTFFWVPESPMYFVLKGEESKAKETLISLGRQNEIEKVLAMKPYSEESKWTEIFTNKTNIKALFIAASLTSFQQMSGVLAVVFFMTSIFQLTGSSLEPYIATIIVGSTQLMSSIVAPVFVEKTGRRRLMAFSTAGCCLSLTLLGLFFYFDKTNQDIANSIKWLPLVSLILFFVFFDAGFAVIPATLTGEMFTSNVRSPGSALSITIGWLFGFGVSSAFGYMIPGLGADVTFWLFALACACAFLFTLVFVPETKGKSLLEIQEMLS